MSEAKSADSRPYHHGDLRRALVDAARRLLEAEGPSALSLRAVAREAGVSPAAPYHHFKDKAELLSCGGPGGPGQAGWRWRGQGDHGLHQLTAWHAHVCFARDNPAPLPRHVRRRARNPCPRAGDKDSAYCMVRDTMIEHGADASQETHLELATVAAWCGAHGLAEMAGFRQFDHLKEALGGDRAFFDAVFSHMGLFPSSHKDC